VGEVNAIWRRRHRSARTQHRALRHGQNPDLHFHFRNRRSSLGLPPPAHPRFAPKMTFGGNDGSSAGVEVKEEEEEEEEETLGKLRDRVIMASARAPVLGPRATFVHIKVDDSTCGEDTDGERGGGGREEATSGEGAREGEEEDEDEEGQDNEEEEEKGQQHAQSPGASSRGRMVAGADAVLPPRRARLPPGSYADSATVELDTDDDYDYEQEEDDEEEEWGDMEEEEEKEAEPRDRSAHVPGVSLSKSGSEAVRLQSLTKGAYLQHGSSGARWQAPGRVTDNVVHDNDSGEEEEEECGTADALVMREGAGRAGSSRFKGVSFVHKRNKWRTECEGKHPGHHTTEKAAARAYTKYLKDGVVPKPTSSSQLKGVYWVKDKSKAGEIHGGAPWIPYDGGGCGARIQQLPQRRHRSCKAPRSPHLAI